MRKKQNESAENYLDRIPQRKTGLPWKKDGDGTVSLEVENKGIANRIAQKLIKKPKISYIHLDEFGSFIWQSTDGEKNIAEIGKELSAQFKDKAEPLYERLAQFFGILESNGFIEWK